MEKRIKIFSGSRIQLLENEINEWLCESEGKLHDIKFNRAAHPDLDPPSLSMALIIYTPEESNEKKD